MWADGVARWRWLALLGGAAVLALLLAYYAGERMGGDAAVPKDSNQRIRVAEVSDVLSALLDPNATVEARSAVLAGSTETVSDAAEGVSALLGAMDDVIAAEVRLVEPLSGHAAYAQVQFIADGSKEPLLGSAVFVCRCGKDNALQIAARNVCSVLASAQAPCRV